jgi:hypothetical protein
MLVTLVIRLVPEGLAAGRFVGQVEHVGNGETELVHGVSDLVGFAQRAVLANGDPTDRVAKGTEGAPAGSAHEQDL